MPNGHSGLNLQNITEGDKETYGDQKKTLSNFEDDYIGIGLKQAKQKLLQQDLNIYNTNY